MNKREPGFYWVKLQGIWTPGMYHPGDGIVFEWSVWLPDEEDIFCESSPEEVGDRIEVPEKYR